MLQFGCKEAAVAMNAKGEVGEGVIRQVSLDSRAIGPDTLFIAIKGERFDGHDYIDKALKNGAVAAVSQRPEDLGKKNVLVVENTEQALCDLANAHRMKFDIPVVGVTGSVGKTTAKEMIACVLSAKYAVKKTEGNHNNQIGMPRTLLELTEKDEAAVMEMGSQGLGEIRQLTLCARPQVAVITKIGVAHLERFGSRENICKGKLEIAEGLPENGVLILNADDAYLMAQKEEEAKKHNILTFGVDDRTADLYAGDISGSAYAQSFILYYKGIELPVYLPTGGLHNVYNALAALAVGVAMGVDLRQGVKALAKYEPAGMRQKVSRFAERTLIEDCYNASPDSMQAALQILSRSEGEKKIAVLGDMLELGSISKEAHYQVGELAAELRIDCLLCIGEDAKEMARAAEEYSGSRTKVVYCATPEEMAKAVVEEATKGSCLLFKGSRGMHMEEYSAFLQAFLGNEKE